MITLAMANIQMMQTYLDADLEVFTSEELLKTLRNDLARIKADFHTIMGILPPELMNKFEDVLVYLNSNLIH